MSTLIARLIREALTLAPTDPALEFEGSWITWGEIHALATSLDRQLTLKGVREDCRVGLLLRNRPPQYAAALSILMGARCLVVLNPILPDAKLAADIAALRLPLVIGERSDLERPGVRKSLRDAGTGAIALSDKLNQPSELILAPEATSVHSGHAPGIMIELLSSGTTGTPKRIPLRTNSFEERFAAGVSYERRPAKDMVQLRSGTVFLTLPFSHISGFWALIQQVTGGRKAVLFERFELDKVRAAIVRHRPAVFTAPPTVLRMILDARIPREELASLRAIIAGTAPLDAAVTDEFFEQYGIAVLQTYGATEFAGAVASWSIEDFREHRIDKRGSVGRLQEGIEARVVDQQTFLPLAPGEEGLLEIKGARLGDSAGWLRTTDRAVLDSDGFLYIRGRADDAIVRGGFKVHPDDVVRALETHPDIREAAVTGIPDPRLGAVPVAAIILRDDCIEPEETALKEYLRQQLSPYQIPTQIRYVSELPRTPSMKVSQPALRDLFLAKN